MSLIVFIFHLNGCQKCFINVSASSTYSLSYFLAILHIRTYKRQCFKSYKVKENFLEKTKKKHFFVDRITSLILFNFPDNVADGI